MKTVAEMYPNFESHYGASDYEPMLDSFGYERVLQVDDSDYQGDSRVLYLDRTTGRVGYLQFGWGSCSGCDSLQACGTADDVAALQASLHDQIRWFDSQKAALEWFETHDWEGDYSWGREEQKQFIDAAKAALGGEIRPEWRTEAVVAIARGILDGNDRAAPVLADALEDAGCDDALLLACLRKGDVPRLGVCLLAGTEQI